MRLPLAAPTALAALLTALPGLASTFHVRPDGGPASRCTGLVDAPAACCGTAQPCAWDHPFRAFPPTGGPKIAGGDTVVIAPGEYRMGLGAPGAEECDPLAPWECHAGRVPSGPDAQHPTRLVGKGWDSGCAVKPQLWGSDRSNWVLDLTGTSHAEVSCLEITDHSGCVEDHTGGLACQRDAPPYGDWASRGIFATDSTNVKLSNLDVHGLAAGGFWAGRLTDWTLEDVRIAGNGSVGWDGDVDGDDSNSGNLVFRRVTVEWNGCGETYPLRQPAGCWGQSAGGYGDGFGTGETGGAWLFEDSAFLYNTSDGLDLLYARTGSSITVRRVRAVGNAGNQVKTNGPALIENSLVVGSCGFFSGKGFTYDVDDCRANGNAISLAVRPGDQVRLVNNTVASQGDCLAIADCWVGPCTGAERVTFRNNVLVGTTDFLQPDERSCLVYQETFPQGDAVWDVDHSLITGVKDDACPGAHASCGGSAGIVNDTLAAFDGHLVAGSRAIDAGTTAGAPAVDLEGKARDARPDVGAYEYGASPSGCAASGTALCLQGSRFRVEASWRDYAGNSGAAQAVGLTADTGYFWFFGRENVEVVIKVLDFCSTGGKWSVYAAGLTDVEVGLTVTDTRTGTAKTYTNPLGTPFLLIRDAPFACP